MAEAIGRSGSIERERSGADCDLLLGGHQRQAHGARGLDVAGELDLGQAALRIEDVIERPRRRAPATGGQLLRPLGGRHDGHGYGSGSIEAAGLRRPGLVRAVAGRRWARCSGRGAGWTCRTCSQAAAMLPAVAQAVQRDNLAGQMTARWDGLARATRSTCRRCWI